MICQLVVARLTGLGGTEAQRHRVGNVGVDIIGGIDVRGFRHRRAAEAGDDWMDAATVMVNDRAVASGTDNNGAGAPRTLIVDLSALGSFSAASVLTIDTTTSPTTGPAAAVSVTPEARMTLNAGGYGVAWLMLKP